MTDPNPNPRAGEKPPSKLSLTPATAAGIIVLIALAVLVALRYGFIDASGD